MRRFFLTASLGIVLLACNAFAQNFKCFVLTPPEQILNGVQRLAIADFTVTPSFKLNDQRSTRTRVIDASASKERFTGAAARLSDMMTAALLDKERGVHDLASGPLGFGKKKEGLSFQEGAFTNVFTLVERSQLQQVMNELALTQSGLINDADAARAGKILGVDAIITGSVNIAGEETWLQEERKEGEKKTQAECKHLTTNVSATLRIIHVETGQVIGSKDSRRLHDQKECKGATLTDPAKKSEPIWRRVGLGLDDKKASSPEAAVELCLAEIVVELVDYFAPSFAEQKLEFAGIEGEQFRRMAEAAKDALKNPSRSNLHTAFVQYSAVVGQDPYNHGAQFNLGVLCEAIGSYKIAIEKYDLAFSLKSDEDKYRKAKDRLARQVEFWDALADMGLELTPDDFEVTAEELAAANRDRVKINGSSKDRHEIKAEPNVASATITQIPGGIELDVLETVAGWYKVRLPLDGKEGFLAQEKAKVLK